LAGSSRYEIVRELGRGGMASVYEVADSAQGGEHVALKRLHRQDDPRSQRRNTELFEREFHTLKQLAHPRIVQVFEFGIDTIGPLYTMELLDGGDLQQLAPLAWREATAIGRDLCSALSILHSRKLLHRDVSPRNVRRASGGQAKLFDFGALAPFGASKIVVGTPPCCSPESIQLRPLDGRTDLYALGATLYYLVGRHAYEARTKPSRHTLVSS
jgi:serine/threonine protein kinase